MLKHNCLTSRKRFKRNTQEEIIAMKKQIIEDFLVKKIKRKEAAKYLKMHENAFSRLKKRYLEEGESALMPKKPGPGQGSTAHNRTPEWIEDIVIDLARYNRFLGPEPLADELFEQYAIKLNPITVWRILERAGIRYFRHYQSIHKKKPQLYCLDKPGEELQLDGCYPFGRSRQLAALSAIDDCSRFVFSRCYTRETANSAILFVKELIKRAPFRIQSIRVDNRYGKDFKHYCEQVLDIEVIANDPYCSNQNGKIERFNKTLKYDFFWSYCKYFESMEELNYKLTQWLHFYNYQRKHKGFKMNKLTPAQKIAHTYLFDTAINIAHAPQKVTGLLQQYVN